MAVRHEKFSDFGSTTNGKFATRYQFDPRVALRASVSSGFRAPSLVQEHYTGLSVGPTIALGLLAANSPAAKMLGAEDVVELTGHPVGGVCPFGLATPLAVYCDVSLQAFDEVLPAAGAVHSAVRIAPQRMAELVDAQWVDVCQEVLQEA